MAEFPRITAQDLADPNLSKLNRVLSNFAAQVVMAPAATNETAPATPAVVNATALQSVPVSTQIPQDGQILVYSASSKSYIPSAPPGASLDSYSADSTGTHTLSGSYTTIPGCSITLVKAGTYVVIGVAYVTFITAGGEIYLGLNVNGTVIAADYGSIASTVTLSVTVGYAWRLPSVAANTPLILQSKQSGTASGSILQPTSLIAIRVGP